MPELKNWTKYSPTIPWRERSLRLRLAYLIGVVWTAYIVLVMFNAFFYMGIVILPIIHNVICAGALISMALLALPRRRGQSIRDMDLISSILIVIAVVGTSYVAYNAEDLLFNWRDAKPFEMFLGFGVMLATMEVSRRTAGKAPIILVLIAFFYFVYSDHFPGFLMSSGYSYERAVAWMFLSGEGMWGPILGTVTTMVPGFILFGAMLRISGASEFFGDLALACLGTYRGGPAKTAVLSSMLFGSLSGSPAANVATTGQITIPMMKKNGFSPEMSGAVEAVASTGGMFTPPIMGSIPFIMADVLGVSYWNICIAAFLPCVVFYAVLLYQVDAEAIRLHVKGLPANALPKVGKVLLGGWHLVLPLGVLIACMGVMNYSAQTSILYTIISLVLCTSFSKETRLTWKKLLIVFDDTASGLINVIPLCTMIGILVGVLNISGTGAGLAGALTDIAGNNLFILLLMTAVTIFFMGMGMTALACYLLAVAMLIPALISAGLIPMVAHMFLFYYGTLSFITPPVAIAAFVASGISDGDSTKTGILASRLGISAFLLPWFFVTNSGLLWIGPFYTILFDFVGTLGSLILLSAGLCGVMFRPIGKLERLILLLMGACFIPPFPVQFNMVLVPLIWLTVAYFYFNRHKPTATTAGRSLT